MSVLRIYTEINCKFEEIIELIFYVMQGYTFTQNQQLDIYETMLKLELKLVLKDTLLKR